MAKILISFLGISIYKESNYCFQNNENFLEKYTATAIFRKYLNQNISIDKMIILGTENSDWHGLIENLLSLCDNHPRISELSKQEQNALVFELVNISKKFNQHSKNKIPYNTQDIQIITEVLNKTIGNFIKCEFVLIAHSRSTKTILEQYSLTKILLNEDVIPQNSEIIFDITNGLRAMPMLAFITLECLKQLKNIKFNDLYYGKVNYPPTKYSNEKKSTDNIIGKIRQISKYSDHYDEQSIFELSKQIKSVIKAKKENFEKYPKSNSSTLDVEMLNITEIDKIFDQSLLISKYKSSGDFNDLKKFIKEKDNIENYTLFQNFSNNLLWGDCINAYNLLKNNVEKILNSIYDNDVKELLENDLSWLKNDNINVALKQLSSNYLKYNAYIHATNSLYSALVTEQDNSRNKKIFKLDLNDLNLNKYRYELLKDFMYVYRSSIVHLNEKNNLLFDNNNPKQIKHEFYTKICSDFSKLGVKQQIPTSNHQDYNVLLTFIGGGDYETCQYMINNESVIDKSSKNIPPFIGVLLSTYLQKKINLNKFLVYGTQTSNWPIFFDSISCLYPPLQNLCVQFKNYYFKNNLLTDELINIINNEFIKFIDITKFQIILKIIPEDVSDFNNLKILKNTLKKSKEITDGCHLYIDATHSFRMLPVFMYIEACALSKIRNIYLEDIFYGDLDDDFINCKYANELLTIKPQINGLKNCLDFEDYTYVTEEINKLLDQFFIDHNLENIVIPCNGNINSLKNLISLHSYSTMISQYEKTGILDYLTPIFQNELSVQSKINSNELLTMIDNFNYGNFYLEISQLDKASSYLKNVYEVLNNVKKNPSPIFELIRPFVVQKLDWLKYNEKFKIYIKLGYSFLKSDLVKSLLYIYEGLKKFVKKDYTNFIFENLEQIVLQKKDKNNIDIFNEIKFKHEKYKQLAIEFYQYSLQNNDLKPYVISDKYLTLKSLEDCIDSFVLKKLFKNEWYKILKTRKNIFHGSFDNKLVNDIKMILENICSNINFQ